MKKELPIMIFHKDNQDYYGGDQDWFPDEWARCAGCASVCAADMACFYEHKLDISYLDFLELMTKMFKLNTPGIMGFPYFYKFAKNFKKYALFKQIVALGYLIQQKYHNDIRNMLP